MLLKLCRKLLLRDLLKHKRELPLRELPEGITNKGFTKAYGGDTTKRVTYAYKGVTNLGFTRVHEGVTIKGVTHAFGGVATKGVTCISQKHRPHGAP